MSKHISLDGPKPEYAKERLTEVDSADKMAARWMDQIDQMDPTIGQDMTNEFMNVQKMQGQINRLEKKVEEESHGFDRIDEYNSDKMVLDNLK